MSIKRIVVYALAGMVTVAMWSSAQAAQPGCKLYKVTAQTLYVSKDAKMSAEYIGVLERGNIACISLVKKVGNRQWGYVSHKKTKGSGSEPINGWVGLKLMELQSQAGDSILASKPKSATMPVQAAPAPVVQSAPKVVIPKVVIPKIANTQPIQPTAPPPTAAAQAEKAAENAYQATVAIGSCGAYKLFEGKYRGTFYGGLAGQYLQASCANKAGQTNVQAAAPYTGTPPGAAYAAPRPGVYTTTSSPGAYPAAPPPGVDPEIARRQLAPDLQTALQGIGCYTSGIDGDWGRGSQAALGRFNALAGTRLPVANPTGEALAAVRAWQGGNCKTVARRKPSKKRKTVKRKKKTYTKKKSTASKTTKKKPSGGGGTIGIIIGGGGIGLGF